MYRLNSKGEDGLRAVLDEHGRGGDYLPAWVSEINAALGNRTEGESLAIELRGVKSWKGHAVFFEPGPDEIETT